MEQSEIKTIFFLDRVDHDELRSVLLTYFGHSAHPALSKRHKFSKQQDGQPLLEVEVNDKGRIAQIILSHDLKKEDILELSTTIRTGLIDNQKLKVAESVLFAINNRIDGFFRYRDWFQILPVPEGSPVVRQSFALHPFLLQFRFVSSPDPMVNSMRRRKIQTKIVRSLSLFTHGIIREESFVADFAWVVKEDKPGTVLSEYRQLGYFYKDRVGEREAFSDCSALKPIDVLAETSYFQIDGNFNRSRLHFLLLPDNLTHLLDATAGLSISDHEKFFLACTWLHYSNKAWLDSPSASFMGLITALECLTEKPSRCPECSSPIKDEIETCEKCGEPKYRLARNFKQFLEQYGPPMEQYPTGKKLMYKVRSQLTHGVSLLNRDVEPSNWFGSSQYEQDELHRNVRFIALVAIYNWLLDKSHSDQSRLTPSPHRSEWLASAKMLGTD